MGYIMPLRRETGLYRGWRFWRVRWISGQPYLSSIYQLWYRWHVGWNALHLVSYDDWLPHYSSFLPSPFGFYAFTKTSELTKYPQLTGSGDYVIGSVLAAGYIVRATRGFRAERARVEYLALVHDVDTSASVLRVCELYDVPPLDINELFALPAGLTDGGRI